MNSKVLSILRFLIAAFMGVLMPLIIDIGNPFLPVFLVVFGLLFTWILTRKNQQTIVDERAKLINQKASNTSMSVFILGTTVVGLILLTLSNRGYPDFSPIAYTLMYSVCGLLFLFTLFGVYYRHKYGG
ncbi:MAG: DUF2178 domain-containing protein [archaeon]